jgi:hypothetical protein
MCNMLQSWAFLADSPVERADGGTLARARHAGTTRFCKTIDTRTSQPTNDGLKESQMTNTPITAESSTDGVPAVDAVHTGVTPGEASIAVRGHSDNGRGVSGSSHTDYGIRAHSNRLSGIRATSYDGVGVEGECITRPDGTSGGPAGSGGTAAGVAGSSAAGAGVLGNGKTAGVEGLSAVGAGVLGNGKTAGVVGTCLEAKGVVGNGMTGGFFDGQFEGIHVVGHHKQAAGIAGYNTTSGPGIFGKSTSGPAGYFEGDVIITHGCTVAGKPVAFQNDVDALRKLVASLQQELTDVATNLAELTATVNFLAAEAAT